MMTLATSIDLLISKNDFKMSYDLQTAAFTFNLRLYSTNFKSLFRDNNGSDRVS